MYEQQSEKPPYMYFEIPEANVTIEDLKPVVFNLLNYEKVNVYFGKFENILNQNPTVMNVTGDQTMDDKPSSEDYPDDFLFEPSLDKILNFFEVQIFTTLFKQTIYESQLSQFASRITAMETALQNIEENSTKLNADSRRFRRLEYNRKQLGAIAGISLWTK
jgi:F-type H+-transporting ATPase subunit gamma